MRIGILTAGGDCPGLNAVIRSVVHRAVVGHGDEVIGFEDGFKGLLDGHFRPLDLNAVSGILARGGTILGSARLERDRLREAAENCEELSRRYGIDALIPIG
ncbi:6-phosphofructokinase, partial [Streptomyces sp. SID7499]|nr:6-phosphofructokinase [Streptomyces sp. SID7499]